MPQSRPQTPVLVFSAIAVVAIIAVIVFLNKLNSGNTGESAETAAQPDNSGDHITLTVDGKHVDETDTGYNGSPEELVGHISEIIIQANASGDITPFVNLVGKNNIATPQINQLQKLASSSRLKLNQAHPFSSVEGTENDWSLNLADKQRILLKLAQNKEGNWQVDKISLPQTTNSIDAEMTTNPKVTPSVQPTETNKELAQATAKVQAFLDAIIKLDPTAASQHVDSAQVSYASLAGLCILFEEGEYKLTKDKAIRNMFLGNNAAGWITRIDTPTKEKAAMFALSTKRKDKDSPWKITEVNLDKLLSDYASRLSGGDIHYVPIIKNPRGGDSIVLFFKIDSTELTRRTQRQLSIVAKLLISASDKKLTISGHTDAVGSDNYNLRLSRERAQSVMTYLTGQGVPAEQIQITSHGKSQPRRPNTTDDGRRANRRAEILLDF